VKSPIRTRLYFARTCIHICAVLTLLFCGTLFVAGQQITGTIVGTVKDTTGALVPEAKVTALNIDTHFARTVSTNGEDGYSIQYLPVGKYTVSVTAAGFKNFQQQNVVLAVDQTQTLNVILAVGGQDQTVTVTDAPPPVNTATSELGRTVEPAEILGLPLVNRNVYAEISLTPGVQANSASSSSNPTGSPNFVVGAPSTQVQINGGIDAGVPTVSYYLDGGLNMTGIRNYGNPLPNPDALEEFRVETSNFSAQYGRMSGAVVTAVTRSGTNQFHGSVFEFLRNTSFNAAPWGATLKAPYHRNQFGGTFGGPVLHDKAFFFFSYAGLRQTIGTFLSGGEVPTALERLGDFTQLPSTEKIPNVIGTNASPNCVTPTKGCLPSSMLDPTAANIMTKYIPLPNSAGNTWSGYFTGPTNMNEYLGKYDQVLSDKDHLSASYFNLEIHQNAFGSGNFPYSINQSYSNQQNANVSNIHSFNANTANQTWLSFTRAAGGRVNLPAVGIDDLGSSYTTQGVKSLPNISVSGYFSAGGSLAGPVSTTDLYDIRNMVSTNKGKHSLAYGAEVSLEKDMYVANLYNYGSFSFSTSTTGSTGNALSDFVAGKVGSMEQDTPYHALLNTWYYSFFLQDNFRAFQRLTLNLGIRYDLEPSPVESQNQTLTFVPGVQSTVVPGAPLGVLFPGDAGVSRGIVETRKHHISPRVGLAWDPFGDGKTAIRAAGGIFYGSVSSNEWTQPTNAQPFTVQQTFNSITSLTNVYGNPASFPNGNPFPYTFTPSNPRFLPAAKVIGISKDYQWPIVYQFNASVERQLPGKVSMNVAYVGTLSHNTPFFTDANYPAYAPGATTSQASINARRPYDPGVLGVVNLLLSNQTASYHALQFSAHRRLTNHFLLNGFYVFSHTFQSFSGSGVGFTAPQDINAMWEERGPSDVDRRHMASMSAIWNLDYYNGDGLWKHILNGWTISPIVTLNSGPPLNITTGSDKNADSYSSDRPNLVPGVNPFLDPHRTRAQAAAAWFNTAAFTPNGPGLGIGVGGADGNTSRDFLRAPGFRNIDLGLFRDIHFERGTTLQFRAEANNVFNLVSLSAPTANLASSQDARITSAYPNRVIQLGARITF
jgi:Carboxypeptidase regulatory-like domain